MILRSTLAFFLAALLLTAPPGRSFAEEAAPPKDAKAVLQKAVKQSAAQEGYHFKMVSTSETARAAAGMMGGGAGAAGLDGSGFARKGGTVRFVDAQLGEIWMRGKKMLIQAPGTQDWKTPESLGPLPAAGARLVRTPLELAEDMLRIAGSATVEGADKAGEIDCWVVAAAGNRAAAEAFVKSTMERLGSLAAMLGGVAQFDLDKADIAYRAWIGKDDGLLYRLENKSRVPVKAGGNAAGAMMGAGRDVDQTTTADFTVYNRDLDLAPPADVKKRLGIK